MTIFKKSIIIAAMAVTAQCAWSVDNYTSLIDGIVANNPDLAAVRSEATAQMLQLAAENNLADPEVGFDYRWGSPEGTVNKWSLTVSQSFEWPGVYHARNKANRAAALASQMRVDQRVSELRLEARIALINYVYAKRQYDLLVRVQSNLDSIRAVTGKLFEHGEATVLDIRKLEFSEFDISRKITEAQNDIESALQTVYVLNGGNYVDLAGLVNYPEVTLQSEDYYIDLALSSAPELNAARKEIEAARLAANAVRMQAFPGFSLGYIHEGEGPENFNGITASVTLPLFSTCNRRAAALQNLEGTTHTLTATEAALKSEIVDEYKHCSRDAYLIAGFGNAFDGHDYLDLVQQTYEARQISALEYLLEIDYFLTACQDYNELLYHYHQSLAKLNRFAKD